MFRELKIVITILFVFLIFGLNSLFVNGGFVTPFLFSKFILFGISLLFLLINLSIKGVFWLVWSVLAYFSLAITDEFTIGYVDHLLNTSMLNHWNELNGFIYLTFFLFYGFLFAQIIPFYQAFRKKWSTVVLSLLCMGQFLFLILGYSLEAYLCMSAYLLIYFLITSRLSGNFKKVVDIIAAQSFALLILELFKYMV